MNRLNKCFQFQIKGMMKSALWFLLIYSVLYAGAVLLLVNLVRHFGNSDGSFNAGFYFAGAIFTFVLVAASYKQNFNFLIMFGNTRKNIFFSSGSAIIVLSVIFSALSVIFDQLDLLLVRRLLGDVDVNSNHNIMNILIYQSDVNIATELIWYAAFFILVCSFALLYGTLTYKLGKAFIIVFWVGFGLLWTGVPVIVGLNGGAVLVKALTSFLCIGVQHGILLAPVNFIIAAVIFGGAAYLVSTRQPQAV